jgi:hypothetical protein
MQCRLKYSARCFRTELWYIYCLFTHTSECYSVKKVKRRYVCCFHVDAPHRFCTTTVFVFLYQFPLTRKLKHSSFRTIGNFYQTVNEQTTLTVNIYLNIEKQFSLLGDLSVQE